MEKLEWRCECSPHIGCRAECTITLFLKNSPDKLSHRMLMMWLGGGMVQQLGPWKEHLYGSNLWGCIGGLQREALMVMWRVWGYAWGCHQTAPSGKLHLQLWPRLHVFRATAFLFLIGKKTLTFPHYSIFTALLEHLRSSLLLALCRCLAGCY